MHLKYSEEDKNMKMPSTREKLGEVKSLLCEALAQDRLDEHEVSFIQAILEEQAAVIDILQEENFQMRENIPQLQPLHDKFLSYREDASDTILSLNMKVNDMHLKTLELEKKLTQFGVDVVCIESSKRKELDNLNNQWQEKLKNMDCQTKKIIEEVVKKHCDAKKSYESTILTLKEQIAHKEAEVAWCQLMMKERDNYIDKEIVNLKKELEVTTMKNQELLQQRLTEVERRANKMTRKCLKLQQDYEQKITNLKREKDLQVQALQKYVNEAEKGTFDNKMEDAVKELEVRYRKIIVSLHSAAQLRRKEDLERISSLERCCTTQSLET